MDSLLIWDSSGKPPNFDRIIYWNESKNKYSLSDYIENNSIELRKQYLSFISQIEKIKINNESIIDIMKVKSGFSLWWMSLVIEKSPFKSKTNLNCIKLLALSDQLEKLAPKSILVISSNKKLINSIKKMANKKNIDGEYHFTKDKISYSFGKLLSNLPFFFQSILFLTKYFLINIKAIINRSDLSLFNNSLLILSYFDNLNIRNLKNNILSSNYWGKLESLINKKRIKVNWLFHFIKSKEVKDVNGAIKIINKVNRSSKNNYYKLIESHLNIKIIFKTAYHWLIIYFKVLFINKKLKRKINDLPLGYLYNSIEEISAESLLGKHLMMNIIWMNLFDEILKKIPKQSNCLYLCENQGWERAFIYFWNKYKHGQIIGVAHSTISFWDLRYFNIKSESNEIMDSQLPVPNALAINGKGQKQELENGPDLCCKLIEVEALRYMYLINYKLNDLLLNSDFDKNILILGDVDQSSTNKMIKIIEEKKDLLNNYNFTFKPHPNNQLNINNYQMKNLKISDESIKVLLEQNNIAITTVFTSAQIDAIFSNKKTLLFHDLNDFNYSFFKNIDGLYYFNNSNQLIDFLERVDQYNYTANNLDYFNLDPNLPSWNKILSNIS